MIYEKRGMWKIEGSSKKYATKREAEKALKNGSIEERPDNRGDYPEQELSESTDTGVLGATWDYTDSFADYTD